MSTVALQEADSRQQLRVLWPRLSLAQRFAVIGSAVVVVASLGLGFWLEAQLERVGVANAALATTLHMNSFVTPIVQELATENRLSTAAEESLDDMMRSPSIRTRISAIKLWGVHGELLYNTSKVEVGKRFEVNDELKAAWTGKVTSKIIFPRNEYEAAYANGQRLIEIYSPITS